MFVGLQGGHNHVKDPDENEQHATKHLWYFWPTELTPKDGHIPPQHDDDDCDNGAHSEDRYTEAQTAGRNLKWFILKQERTL